MVEIKDLFDLDKTIAKELFEGKTYPWEVLDEIKSFILKLGPTLDPEEYANPYEGVWVAKDATVFPSAYLGAPCIIDHGAEIRHCAFIRGSAIVGKNAVVGNQRGAEKRCALRQRPDPALQLRRRLRPRL